MYARADHTIIVTLVAGLVAFYCGVASLVSLTGSTAPYTGLWLGAAAVLWFAVSIVWIYTWTTDNKEAAAHTTPGQANRNVNTLVGYLWKFLLATIILLSLVLAGIVQVQPAFIVPASAFPLVLVVWILAGGQYPALLARP